MVASFSTESPAQPGRGAGATCDVESNAPGTVLNLRRSSGSLAKVAAMRRATPRPLKAPSLSFQCKNVKPTLMRPTITTALAAKKVQRTKWYFFSSPSRRA